MPTSDELLDQAAAIRENAPPAPTLASDSLLDGIATERKQRTDLVLDVVSTRNPDKAAEANRLSKQFGLDVATVEKNQDEIARAARIKEVQGLLQASPFLSRQMQDPRFAAIAQDDVKNLGDIEKVMQFFKGTGRAALSGLYGASSGVVGVAQAPFEIAAPLLDPLTGRILPENPLRRVAEGLGTYRKGIAATAKSYEQQGDGIAESGWYSGIGSLARNLAALPLAFLPGGQGAALTGMVAPVFGEEYGRARDKGIAPGQAAAYGASQAAIEYATEKIPMSRLIGDIKAGTPFLKTLAMQAALEVPGEQVATILQDLNEWAVLNPNKPFSSYLEERPSAAAQTLIATLVGVGGQTTIVKGVDMALAHVDGRAEAAQRAEQATKTIEGLNKLAAANKVKDRDAEALENYVAQVAEDGPVQNLYIDANTLMQSGMAEQIAAVSPAVAEQLPTALQTGGEVRIPISEYTARIAGTEFAQSLVDDIRVEGEQFTRRQAQEYMQSGAAQELEQMVEKMLTEKQGDQEFKASQERVKQTVLDQLNAINRFTPQKNEIDAMLIASRSAVRAAQLGMTPEQFFEKQLLRVADEQWRTDHPADEALLSREKPMHDYQMRAYQLERAFEAMGLTVRVDGSGISRSTYVEVESPEYTQSDGDLGEIIKFRVSDHELPHSYKQPDFDVIADGVEHGGVAWNKSGTWVEAVEWLSGLWGIPVPPVIKATKSRAATQEQKDTQKRKRQAVRYAEERLSRFDAAVAGGVVKAKRSGTGVWMLEGLKASDKPFLGRHPGVTFSEEAAIAMAREKLAAEIEARKLEMEGAPAANKSGMSGLPGNGTQERQAVRADDSGSLEEPAQSEGAAQLGMTPEQFFEKQLLRVAAEGVAGEGVLSQGAREVDPNTLTFREGQQNRLDAVRENFPPGSGYFPAVTILDESGNREILDGHNRAAVAKERGDALPVVDITRAEYDALTLAGYDDIEISYAALVRARERDAAMSLDQQFPGSNVESRGEDAYQALKAQQSPNYTADTITIDGITRPATNSNGQRIAQTEEGLRNFWRWFGDSKVVDAEGKPLVVYHGTNSDIEAFDPKKIGSNFDLDEDGFFFSGSTVEASGFADPQSQFLAAGMSDDRKLPPREGGNVLPVYLSLKNPITIGAYTEAFYTSPKIEIDDEGISLVDYFDDNRRSIIAFAKEGGHDGVLFQHKGKTLGVAFDPPQIKSAIGNRGTFDPNDPNILKQDKDAARGAFNPATNTITLLKGADLSTFLHEAGHYFFEGDIALAAELANKPNLTEGERQILADVSTLFTWHGIQGDIDAQLGQWYGMSFEERRAYHERTAESFEAYLFEGKAPSIELRPYFQKFRAWLINVYKSLKDFIARNPEAGKLDDTVRQVFDRMLATTEQIQLAEQGRSMLPLFATAEQAGMSVEEFAAYQALGIEATSDAIQDVQARTLRDLAWTRNARSREIKRLQREAKARRDEVMMEIRREVMSQPVYRAWQFLTGKITVDDKLPKLDRPKSNPNSVDESQDSLFVAIAKLGGIQRDQLESEWGIDPKEKVAQPVFGKPVIRRDGGLSIDGMAEALSQYGYLKLDEHGKWDNREFEELFFDELGGSPQYSNAVDPEIFQDRRPGDQVRNVEALGAGRFDLAALNSLGIPDEIIEHVKNLKMTAKDGLHPDIVAEMFGFSSGDELVRTLAAAEAPKVEIEGRTDQALLERYGELATPEAIERAADKAIHNDARGRFVATEANALAKATGQRKVLASAARDFARAMIARLKVRDIRPGQYANAEVRAAKAAAAASQSGDLATAAAEKRNQLVQNYATRAAYDAQEEVEKGVRYLKKFDGDIKGLDPDYADQIAQLLERFDLRKLSLKAIDKRTALASWIESQREQGLEPEIPDRLKNEAFRKSYRDLTVEELRGLVDTVKQIEHLGRLKDRLLTAADNRAFEAVKVEIVQSINDNAGNRVADTRTPTTNLGLVAQQLKRFWASHIKAATWARVLDGGKDGGPMWNYLVRSANERGDMETNMRAEATEKLTAILAPVFKLGKMGGKGQFFPTINRSLNREARIALALNTGNAGNLQRLLGGEGWTEAQILPVLQSLTAEEKAAVQAVWDYFESYRPQIAAKERRVYGREPQWVEPGTRVAEAIGLRGGYYPIKYDPAASQRAEEHADAEGAKRQLQGAYTSATTRRSFTKTRVEEVSGRPLLYTLAGLYSGVNDVIHDLAWHEWLIDANRLMRSKSIDAAIRNHYGPEAKAQFKTWAADIAEGDRGAANAGEAALGFLRQGISAAGLGFNVVSAAMQVLGFNQSIVRIGTKWVGRGIAQYIGSPIATAREVVGKSDFMASRARTQFRELNELRNQVQDESPAMRNVRLGTYFLMMRVQRMVDVPTWIGAYEKAIAGGNDEDRAIALADQAVIDSQGSGMTKDLSAIERGGPALKLFTVFYSYMNTAFNMGVAQTMTASSKAKLAADYLLLFVVPVVLGTALKQALIPGGDDEWDPEALARKLAAEQLSYLMGLMVVVREFGEAAKIVTGASGTGRDYGGPAGLRAIDDTFTFLKQATQGEFDDAFRKAAVNLVGDLTGLPAAQINRSITGAEALAEGETQNPATLLFGVQK